MTIVVLAVGRPDRGRYGALFDEYAGRIRRFGVAFEERFVPAVKPGGRFSDAHVRQREAAALREALPARCRIIALSPDAQAMKTEVFARRLQAWSVPAATFVVGGPLGLDHELVQSASAAVSLSAMTLPHELARVVLAEQIYRAVTILRGVPYHK